MARIIIGDELRRQAALAGRLERRLCLSSLMEFLSYEPMGSVAALYGLRRTGKTTMLLQAAFDSGRIDECAYIMPKEGEDFDSLYEIVDTITTQKGITAVFLDEITALRDFPQNMNILSDIVAMGNIHVILTGTDSLGLHIAKDHVLFDRIRAFIHTTHIPFCEHQNLFGTADIDSYIETGGLLSGILGFRQYVADSIVANIRNSLLRSGCAGCLDDLINDGSFDATVNRIVNHEQSRFIARIANMEPKCPDITMSYRDLSPDERKKLHLEMGSLSLYEISRMLGKEILGDVPGATKKQLLELNRLFLEMDFIVPHVLAKPETLELVQSRESIRELTSPDQELMYGTAQDPLDFCWAFTQPGLRWAQVEALRNGLLRKSVIGPESFKKIGLYAKGGILEDIIITETWKRTEESLMPMFTYRRGNGEIDMVVVHEDDFDVWEIKHSSRKSPEHTRHIVNPAFLAELSEKFGRLRHAGVLYNGDDDSFACNIAYNKNFPPLSEVQFQNIAGFLLDNPYGPWPVEKFKPKYMAERIHNATDPKP